MKLKELSFNLLILLTLGFGLYACSGKDVDPNDPQAQLSDAEEDIQDKRYLMALDKLKNIKNKFPYSNVATTAQLRIADVNYLDESYPDAAAAYETFRDLHPKHEKADYVIFRIGESYFNQLPSTVDRDLTPATKAIEAYKELSAVYPKSTYVPDAKKHLEESIELLAQKEKYIGDFYYKRDMFDSAARRYEKIATKYIGTTVEEYAYLRWGKSLINQGEQPDSHEKKPTLEAEARHVFKTYLSRFPSGTFTAEVETLLGGIHE